MNKEIVKSNFSKYARYYDKYCNIQNLCALTLIEKIESNGIERILDIGCGTGNYTRLLREKFPASRIKAIDISPRMIEVARNKLKDDGIEFVIADGEKMDSEERFGLISSNASFQWFDDLGNALRMYKTLLDGGGIILFSCFGPLTFHELDKSLKELLGRDAAVSSSNFFEKKRIGEILTRLFNDIEIEEMIYKENYKSLSEFLKKIKYTGARGNGEEKKKLWTIGAMNELELIYRKRWKDISATYQVFFCKGAK